MVPGKDDASTNMLALRRNLIAICRLLDADRELLVGPTRHLMLDYVLQRLKKKRNSKRGSYFVCSFVRRDAMTCDGWPVAAVRELR
jgi:hypothetical protein